VKVNQKTDSIGVVFRAFNDIDHVVPIIVALRERDKEIPITCILLDLHISPSGNWQLRLLESLGVRVIEFFEIIGVAPSDVEFLRRRAKAQPSLAGRLKWRALRGFFVRRRYDRELSIRGPDLIIKSIFKKSKNPVLIVDHKSSEFYRKLVNQARSYGVRVVSVPHGSSMGRNLEQAQRLSSEVGGVDEKLVAFSQVVAANAIQKANIVSQQNRDPRDVVVLGDPRFSVDWVRQRRALVLREKKMERSHSHLKVVFMATKIEGRCHPAEVQKYLNIVAELPELDLIVKAHPRGLIDPIFISSRWTVAAKDVDSSVLIEWADLILFTHSSIVLEAVVLDKPVAFLKGVTTSSLYHESLAVSWSINSEEELEYLVRRFLNDHKSRTYTGEQRTELLSTFVCAGNDDVARRYTDFLLLDLRPNDV
jgi:ribosomal protein L7Ae-like RNA K-turn-binding protein